MPSAVANNILQHENIFFSKMSATWIPSKSDLHTVTWIFMLVKETTVVGRPRIDIPPRQYADEVPQQWRNGSNFRMALSGKYSCQIEGPVRME